MTVASALVAPQNMRPIATRIVKARALAAPFLTGVGCAQRELRNMNPMAIWIATEIVLVVQDQIVVVNVQVGILVMLQIVIKTVMAIVLAALK